MVIVDLKYLAKELADKLHRDYQEAKRVVPLVFSNVRGVLNTLSSEETQKLSVGNLSDFKLVPEDILNREELARSLLPPMGIPMSTAQSYVRGLEELISSSLAHNYEVEIRPLGKFYREEGEDIFLQKYGFKDRLRMAGIELKLG